MVVPTSTVLSTRHEQPCPCTVAVRPRRKLLRAIRHRAASPNVSRSMFRVPAKPGILTSSGEGVATPGGHAPRQAVASLLCLSWNRARLPLRGLRSFVAAAAPRNKCSVGRQGPEPRRALPAAEGGGSIALIAARARDRSRELRNSKRLGKKKNPSTSQPLKLRHRIERERTQARVVAVCRLRRNQAGRAERIGES